MASNELFTHGFRTQNKLKDRRNLLKRILSEADQPTRVDVNKLAVDAQSAGENVIVSYRPALRAAKLVLDVFIPL